VAPGGVVGGPPVGGPLPDIADHLVQTVAVRRVSADGGGTAVPVVQRVLGGEGALPDVAEVLAVGGELVAPGIAGLVEPAAGGALPLSLGRQASAGPGAERYRVRPRDVHDRVVLPPGEVRLRALRPVPVGAVHATPPRRRRGPLTHLPY
jgi:hypothetical protein